MDNIFKLWLSFWLGAGICSLLNLFLNIISVSQINLLNCSFVITGIAVLGLLLTIIIFKFKKKR